ncbi:MAG TPA: hypothetical protein VK465_18245 [Fibrobacteria bacterium]|nr:hypothetical protein [Fibrobacteria bacterium]
MNTPRSAESGITMVEVLVASVVGALVLAGTFRLWKSNHEEGYRIQKKTELRDMMALSSKRIQRSITLAGLGIDRAPTLAKSDAVGSDTLFLFTNESEQKSAALSDLIQGQSYVQVGNTSIFHGIGYLVISNGSRGEVHAIEHIEGSMVTLREPLKGEYSMTATTLFPARREAYFTDQQGSRLIRMVDGTSRVIAENIRNFQVSFRDSRGASTEDAAATRTVHFSFTGEYPARPGSLSSVVFSSTAIPRNVL